MRKRFGTTYPQLDFDRMVGLGLWYSKHVTIFIIVDDYGLE